MRKTYVKAEFRLMLTENADVLTVSLISANNLEGKEEDGGLFADLFPTNIG